jgi:tetratricopeptide (TPR) repeat protein
MSSADEFLRDHPNGGPGSAEALYFEGRAYEHRAETAAAANNEAGSKQDLQNAQWSYERATQQTPSAQLEPLLHAGIANVAYFQDNYEKAMNEWAQAYPGLQGNDTKAWVLYRIGLCQQRLGRFEQADTNFALVRQQFPTSEPAARAATHQGARAFYVQVGAYTDARNADGAVATLKSQGFTATKATEPSGKQAVRVGPAQTYADAKTLKSRLLEKYPTAMIEP